MNHQGKLIQNLREGFLQHYINEDSKNNYGIFCNFEYIFQGELKAKIRMSSISSETILSESMNNSQFHRGDSESLHSLERRGSWGLDVNSKYNLGNGKTFN